MPTPTRSLKLTGASNFRDLGGYAGQGGRQVRWRWLFRSDHLAGTQPGLRGFTRPNLFRMRQFYEAYRDDAKVSPVVIQTHPEALTSSCTSTQLI